MTLPHVISTLHGLAKDYVLKLINNIYGQNKLLKFLVIIGIKSCRKSIFSILFLMSVSL